MIRAFVLAIVLVGCGGEIPPPPPTDAAPEASEPDAGPQDAPAETCVAFGAPDVCVVWR